MVLSSSPTRPTPPPSAEPKGFVAFDFDGTLTWTDSLLLFFRLWLGREFFALMAPTLLGLDLDRDAVKARATKAAFAGAHGREFEDACAFYGGAVLPQLLRPDALDAILQARQDQHSTLIISASFEDYLIPFAKSRGFSAVIATQLARADGGTLTGALAGPNCRAEEKVRRFEAHAGPDARLVRAYGDTSGDRALLARAERGFYRAFRAKPSTLARNKILAMAKADFPRPKHRPWSKQRP